MNTNLIKFQLGDLGLYFTNVKQLHELFLVLGINEYPKYSLMSNAIYYEDGELKITSETFVPKKEVLSVEDFLDKEEVKKLIHSLTNKDKFMKGLATVNLTEEELETISLKYKFQIDSYVEGIPAPEILDLILINGVLYSFYEKLENVTHLDLVWYKTY